ncbi:MAG: hypothetical protein Q4G25_13550 [Paracoccus sp. (in: a-proteobacteria)]|nr:hypothetical protein [Paracoccus sp. (in: a-proteobacteria)]
MKAGDRIINALRQIDRAVRVRGLRHTLGLALKVLWQEGPAGVRGRLDALGPALRPARPSGPRAALIVTTPHTLHFARRMAAVMSQAGWPAELSDSDRHARDFDLIIAFAPQNFPDLPPDRTIAFQVEPHGAWPRWGSDYPARLARFRAVFDYSTTNIERLRAYMPLRKLYHVPFSPLAAQAGPTERRGVLFYGDVTAARRQAMLAGLRERVPELDIETNLFGPAMAARLERALIVVNIHATEGAVLESARISEALAAGAVVVSETAPDQDDDPEMAARVTFTPEGDITAMADALRRLLDDPATLTAMQERAATPARDRFRLGILRAMQGLDLLTPAEFETLAPDYPSPLEDQMPGVMPRLCLSLPETPARRHGFAARQPGWPVWPGIKADPGWRGCALSYRMMMRALRDAGTPEALIVEDDAVLPADFEHILQLARQVMDRRDADLFSGLIVDLHEDTRVLAVDQIDGITFVTLDRAVMMMCNLYRGRMIDWLADWDDTDTNAFTNAIDRYMERATHLRVVTTLPFGATYLREAVSSLRESENDRYDALRARSEARLAAKLAEFRARNPDAPQP